MDTRGVEVGCRSGPLAGVKGRGCVKLSCNAVTASLDASTMNVQYVEDRRAGKPAKKNSRHPTVSTCGPCCTAVVGDNSF